MFVLLVELKIQPDKVELFGRMIDEQARHTPAVEPGCHQFDVCQQENDPSTFVLYELYENKAAFELHMKMEYTTRFLADAAPMIVGRNIRGFKRRD